MKKEEADLARLHESLRRIGLTFPYLVGLVQRINVQLDKRVETMGIFDTGRLIVNPKFLRLLNDKDLMFVLTHEIYHLTLRTHERGQGSDPTAFNHAHDFIINDLLKHELQVRQIPAGGLDWPDARHLSAEAILEQVHRNGCCPMKSWDPQANYPQMHYPGDGASPGEPTSDVLSRRLERRMFPELSAADQQTEAAGIEEAAQAALGRQAMMEIMKGRGNQTGGEQDMVSALRGLYRPPWELGLQRWMESVAPSDRSYARPSRRGADRTDVVLPGRKREGWTIHIVLDTSGSMYEDLPVALGAISDFCQAMGVEEIHLIQCDAAVHRDEILSPAELTRWRVSGYGGSDLSPAMLRLAEQVGVEAAIILTDGEIDYPPHAMPYNVLWVLPAWKSVDSFHPPYGKVLSMTHA
jgi:predicted metal-dependent peptidase